MVMVLPGSPLPSRVMVSSAVLPSPFTPVSSPTPVITGAAGALVSIVQVPALIGAEVLPLASVAVTVSGCWPSARGPVVMV